MDGILKRMPENIKKGNLMQKNLLVLLNLAILSVMVSAEINYTDSHSSPQAYDGWRMGVQTWSFNRFTLFEAIDKTRSLGLSYIQAYPGQKISGDIDAGFGPDLTSEQKQAIKEKLVDAGIKIYAFGVTGVPNDEADARKLFEFSKEMGIETIASEPKSEQFDLIDRLCQEYEIKLAIHNHPKPRYYWNPDTVLKVCEGRSKWIGACTDVGHWVRSGLDPVECLKKLEGRIHDVHIKEIDDGHDVVWGTGQGRIKGVLEELHRQGYRGTFSIEYEYNWDNNVPEIRQSVAYFNDVASALNPTGWADLVKIDLSNIDAPGNNWAFKDGELVLNPLKKGSDLWTKVKYGNFILDLEYKLDEQTNSGVFLRAGDHNWLPWVEVQVVDSYGKPVDKHSVGGIYDIIAPTVNAVKPAGQWNRMTITADGPLVRVILNGKLVVDINLDDWTEAHKNPDGTKNKFNVAYKDLPRSGIIGLQDHGGKVWYRNIRIKEL
jgi:sugar phosphate isomerase/epimerase